MPDTTKGAAKQDSACKRWVFTVNNPEEGYSIATEDWAYLVYGREVGEKCGTPHIQGYGVLLKRKRRSAVCKLLGGKAFVDKAKGSADANREYCTKGGDFVEHGELPKSGGEATKEHWDLWLEAAKRGAYEEIPSKILVRHYASICRIAQDYLAKPADLPEGTVAGIWVWGKPGVGKSHYVRSTYVDVYDKNLNKWWDGYQGQKVTVLDDVDRHHVQWLPFLLKRWADRYSFPAEMKGTTRQIRPELIVVTSNYSLEKWLSMREVDAGTGDLNEAVRRRFKVLHMRDRDTVVEEDGLVPELNGSGFTL